MPYAFQPESWANFVEQLGEMVTYIFIVEMALKLIGLGCHGYWSDGWNQLDGIIVTLSIIEIAITLLLADTGVNISFLRMLRLLRLLRLLKAMPGLYKIVMAFIKAIPQIANVFILMFLIQFIFALLGMQTFGGTSLSADSRWHFDYFYNAMLTVFGVFTGGWVDAYQACSEVVGVATSAIFFVSALLIGFFIILNLFIAILLEAFADDDEEEEGAEAEAEAEAEAAKAAEEEAEAAAKLAALAGVKMEDDDTEEELPPLDGIALGCLEHDHPLRLCAQYIVCSRPFDTFIIALILISSACLALDVPRLDPHSELKANLDYMNYWMTGGRSTSHTLLHPT